MDNQWRLWDYQLWTSKSGLLQHCQSPLAVPGSSMAILVIVNIWRSFPFPMLIYWATLKGINKEMYEVASVDGANAVQSFLDYSSPPKGYDDSFSCIAYCLDCHLF